MLASVGAQRGCENCRPALGERGPRSSACHLGGSPPGLVTGAKPLPTGRHRWRAQPTRERRASL